MKWISRKEELILVGVRNLGNNAYGVTLRAYLSRITGKYWSIGAIYDVLDRLVQKDLLSGFEGAPVAERGGRSRRYYRITKGGFEALKEIQEIHKSIYAGFSGVTLENE